MAHLALSSESDTMAEDGSPFPMAVGCPGCSTRYRIDGPRRFTCPHCNNHISILPDGRVEIVPAATRKGLMDRLEDPPDPDHDSSEVVRHLKRELARLEAVSTSPGPVAAAPDDPGPLQSPLKQKDEPWMEGEENGGPALEIRLGRGSQAGSSGMVGSAEGKAGGTVPGADDPPDLVEKVTMASGATELESASPGISGSGAYPSSEPVPVQTDQPVSPQQQSALPAQPASTSSHQPGPTTTTQPTQVASTVAPAGGPGIRSRGRRIRLPAPAPTDPGYPGHKSARYPLGSNPKKKTVAVLMVIIIIVLAGIVVSLRWNDDLSVTVPPLHMGDQGKYRVNGRIYVSSPDGIQAGNNILRNLEINLDGQLWYVLNGTADVSDGFGITHTTLDTFLYQKLKLSGSVETVVITDAGEVETKTSTYTSLVTNRTVRSSMFSDLDLRILSLFTLRSVDHGVYYPAGGDLQNPIFAMGDQTFTQGDSGSLASGQLTWKAEKREKVHGWDCLRLSLTDTDTDSEWREFSVDVWVANECSLPVKVRIQAGMDTTKLNPAYQALLSRITGTTGLIEMDYTAEMFHFIRGQEKVPWDPDGKDPSVMERGGARFDSDWSYAPLIGNTTTSFDPDFSPDRAALFAVSQSSDLKSFVTRHEDTVYIVDGEYSVHNGTQYWELLFGYRSGGVDTRSRAYNVTVSKKGPLMAIHADAGEVETPNPSNSRGEIQRALNIADSETIFGDMGHLRPLFRDEEIGFEDRDSGVTTLKIRNNHLHTGLMMSSGFNPLLSTTIPAGYGYYLGRQRTHGDTMYLREGMIDSQNGRAIYELAHEHEYRFGSLL